MSFNFVRKEISPHKDMEKKFQSVTSNLKGGWEQV